MPQRFMRRYSVMRDTPSERAALLTFQCAARSCSSSNAASREPAAGCVEIASTFRSERVQFFSMGLQLRGRS